MPTTRLFVIADNARGGLALAQLAALTTHLDRAQFAVSSALLDLGENRVSVEDLGLGVDCNSPNPESRIPNPESPAPVPRSGRWPVDPLAVYRLRQAIQASQPDIVLTIGETAAIDGRLAAVLAGHKRIVACWPSIDFDYLAGGLTRLGRFLARRTERILVASNAEREAAIANRWSADRLSVVPPAVSPIPIVSTREAAFTSVGIPASARVIAVVAPWSPRHRVKETIWSFDLVSGMRRDTHLLIVGEGPERADLEAFRDSQACKDLVHFAGWTQLPPDWLAHCDAVWSPDPAPRVAYATLQAAATGVPVIAVDTPAHRAFLTSGETGVLIPLAVRPAAPQATLPLLEDSALHQRISQAARDHMAATHSPEQTAAAIAAILTGRPG
jgi:glycosyltransferase involved in cell wall biosynthesis